MRKSLFAWALAVCAAFAPAWGLAGEAEDEVVANQIAQNLKESGRLQNYRIGVAFRDGTAWLNGSVTNADQLVAALEVAQQTEGVKQVVNRLETKPAASTASKQPISARLRSTVGGIRSTGNADGQIPVAEARQDVQLTASTVEEQVARQSMQRSMGPMAAGQGNRQLMMPQQHQAMMMPQQGPAGPAQRMAMAPQPPQMGRQPMRTAQRNNAPVPYARMANAKAGGHNQGMQPSPGFVPGTGAVTPARYDHANMPGYAWPSYASHPNYAAVTYPKQYSPTAWPYIGPFYPYPQVPLGWRKVTLQWDDGWWMLDFHEKK